MMDMAMMTELARPRVLRRLSLAIALSLAGTAAQAQDTPPPADDAGAAQAQEPQRNAREPRRSRRARTEISAYLEVAQVLSADLGNGGDTLTYTSLAAGADGQISTRRVTAQMSIRYQRNVEWNNGGVDSDVISGIAAVNAQIVPGALSFDAGAMATRTGGDGRVFGITNRDASVDLYSAYAGPTLSTNVGPLAVNAAYRLGYVKVNDHRAGGTLDSDFDDATAHSATASIGMAPGRLPIGWTVGAGYARTDSGGRWDQRFEGMYVRGDLVFPVSPTLAVTAGVGYEDIEADQRDFARDAGGAPVIGPNGPTPDPTRPRLLTYQLDGMMYDAGVIWRPSPRTELQLRAGRRYGGTTVAGSLDHRLNEHSGIHAEIFDSVDTFSNLVAGEVAGLPDQFDANRDPLTGGLSGCVFGGQGGGRCFDRSLSAINGNSFRMRGGSLVFSGERGLWSYGVGAGYAHRRYNRPAIGSFAAFAGEDDVYSIYGTVGRQLSRTSEVNFDAFASWYDSDVNVGTVSTMGATVSYNRSFLLDRLQLMAALGLYHSDDGVEDSTNASASGGLRYTF
jgi:hypothetical protein